jgi:carboxypeptidase C (cathepsin A)
LDVTDLVFIDQVSTGYSRAVPGVDAKQYHGIKPDIASIGEFIRLWITRNERWASPKFLAGESYGTTRSAGLAEYLQTRYGMDLNGLVLVSSVLNWQAILTREGNDMPYYLFLPTYAATAWYHKKLPPELSGDLGKTLREVEDFALHEYAPALLEGDQLPAARRQELAARIARYSGLSTDFVLRANLRVSSPVSRRSCCATAARSSAAWTAASWAPTSTRWGRLRSTTRPTFRSTPPTRRRPTTTCGASSGSRTITPTNARPTSSNGARRDSR